jgi:RNA polymerase sigma factor (sigma-70 family)
MYLTGMEAMTKAAAGDLSQIIASAAAGDDVAFARIVAAHHREMVRICVVVSRDQTIGEEAAQAAWSIAWKKLGSLREPDRLRPWLITVAVNETRKLVKKRARRREVESISEPPEQPGGVDPATGVGYLDLQEAMERLDPDDRALLALRYVAGFDAPELASVIGLSPSGTRTRLERLLKRLRQDLSHG